MDNSSNCIKLNDLIMEISTAIYDCFEAEVETSGESITLTFGNGQKFGLEVKQCA